MAERNLSIRLSVRDGDTVRRALSQLGSEGQAALRRIESASAPASRGLLAVNAAASDLHSGVASLAGRLGPLGAALSSLGPAGLAAAAAAAASASAFGVLRNSIAAADEIGDFALQAGISAERLQALRFIAVQTGGSVDDFDRGIRRLNRSIGEAANNIGESGNVFRRLGIDVRDTNGEIRSTDQVFDDLIGALERIESPSERAALAAKLLGEEGGTRLAGMLALGAEAMRDQEQAARDLGIVIEQELLDKAGEWQNRWDRFWTTMTAITRRASLEIAASLEDAFNHGAISDASLEQLRRRLASVDEELSHLQTGIDEFGDEGSSQALAIDALIRTRIELMRQIRALEEPPPEQAPAGRGGSRFSFIGPGRGTLDGSELTFGTRLPNSPFEVGGGIANALQVGGGGGGSLGPAADQNREAVDELGRYIVGLQEAARLAGLETLERQQALAVARAQDIAQRQYTDGVRDTAELRQEEIDKINIAVAAQENLNRAMVDAQPAAAGIGDILARGIGQAVIDFENFGQTALNVLQQIQAAIVEALVVDPIAGLFKGGGGGGGLGGILGNAFSFVTSLFGFSQGGIMTSRGPLPLHAYAGGGIADRPQLALFGEGRRPEAFVPLPDGRSIPVTMRGEGGGVTNIYNIDARGASPGTEDRILAALRDLDSSIEPRAVRAVQGSRFRDPGLFGRHQ